jgi:hypothetical protein
MRKMIAYALAMFICVAATAACSTGNVPLNATQQQQTMSAPANNSSGGGGGGGGGGY